MESLGPAADGLRHRNIPMHTTSDEEARQTVLKLNTLEENGAVEKDKKTFGRTPDGTVFTVPTTHDMVSQLLSPREPKNVSDAFVLLIIALHICAFGTLSSTYRIPVLCFTFFCWRAGYNVGIGWLLLKQSNQKTLVRWALKSTLFGSSEKCEYPKLRSFIKSELETKIPKHYDFDTAPLEYNTWLVFRRIVDLILMCDFVSYILFAMACSHRPAGESVAVTAVRWTIGTVLFAFNLWVKLDAHRVVKDYAWYWGDFFYLIDQELTFDGVFEMAPHPMYSIGYVGYYGISLAAASYKVLFVSIIAHAAQFAFLVWVENPHIERTYNSPPPRRHTNELPKATDDVPAIVRPGTATFWPNPAPQQPIATHNLLGLQNLDLYRTTDSSVLVMSFFLFALTVSAPNTIASQAFFIFNAAICRLWFSVGIGYLLNRQSNKKKWTRHFLKYGESTNEAWRQWKGTYHMSMIMCYASFIAAAWKMYTIPSDWEYGLVLLKHVVGLFLITVQIWVSVSIYDSLGEFGWFFGDFFFDHSPKLTYSGIYRFLNNPERVLGLAGVWGTALITNSKAIFALALLSHTLSLAFIQLVERPHMQKLYGRSLRQDSGLVRSIRRSLPPPFRQWQDGMDKVIGDALDVVEESLDATALKLTATLDTLRQDVKAMFHRYPARFPMVSFESDSLDIDSALYSIEIEGVQASSAAIEQRSPIAVMEAGSTLGSTALVLEYGAPIKIKWTAPMNHSKQDWIGLYMIADNTSREITTLPSRGRWTATNVGEYDTTSAEVGILSYDVKVTRRHGLDQEADCLTGEMVFAGNKIWWTQGSFEFRYHHNGKHRVLAISVPFEVRIPLFSDEDLDLATPVNNQTSSQNDSLIRHEIQRILLPIVQNCFDRDEEIAPRTVDEAFGSLVERDGKFARRVVYAIRHMFGIEFASEVVKADGKVENLAWRIWEAKKVLAPYIMSRSRRASTPTGELMQQEFMSKA